MVYTVLRLMLHAVLLVVLCGQLRPVLLRRRWIVFRLAARAGSAVAVWPLQVVLWQLWMGLLPEL